jgi:glycosyltransferase 2 family protein
LTKKRVRGLVQVTLSLLLLVGILSQVHLTEVWGALSQMLPGWLLLAFGLFLLGVAVRAVRWQVLLRALGVHRPLSELLIWYFVGGFFNVILPTGFGGDAVRVVELAQDTSRPGAVLNSVLVDRYLGIMVLLPMGLIAGLVARASGGWPGGRVGVFALTALLFVAGLLAAWLLRRPWWARLAAPKPDGQMSLAGRLVRLLRLPALSEAVMPYDRRTMFEALAVSLAFNLLQIGWNMALAYGLGLRLPSTVFLVFVPLTAVSLLLPAFGGLGVRELSYVGLFGSVGVPAPSAMALSLSVYAITAAGGLVGGILYLGLGLRATRGSRVPRQQAAAERAAKQPAQES